MDTRPTVLVMVPQEKNLAKWQRKLAQGVIDWLAAKNLRVTLDGRDADRLEERIERMRQSQGVLVLALGQWEARRLYRSRKKSFLVPSEFAHIANAMAMAAGRPLLVLKEKSVAARGSLKEGYVHPVLAVPSKAGPEWLESSDFLDAGSEWLAKVGLQRHVFLGYCSRARSLARKVHRFCEESLQLSVLDWHEFPAGRTVIDNITEAEHRTLCGVFLFTGDDGLKSGKSRLEVPRDNVVYEAGFFAGAKGPHRTLILREGDAKVPTDLGGVTRVDFRRRSDFAQCDGVIRGYFEHLLHPQTPPPSLR